MTHLPIIEFPESIHSYPSNMARFFVAALVASCYLVTEAGKDPMFFFHPIYFKDSTDA